MNIIVMQQHESWLYCLYCSWLLKNDFLVLQVQSPYVLENLHPDSFYEVYVEAGNSHGPGEPSQRIVFKTLSVVSASSIDRLVSKKLSTVEITSKSPIKGFSYQRRRAARCFLQHNRMLCKCWSQWYLHASVFVWCEHVAAESPSRNLWQRIP